MAKVQEMVKGDDLENGASRGIKSEMTSSLYACSELFMLDNCALLWPWLHSFRRKNPSKVTKASLPKKEEENKAAKSMGRICFVCLFPMHLLLPSSR